MSFLTLTRNTNVLIISTSVYIVSINAIYVLFEDLQFFTVLWFVIWLKMHAVPGGSAHYIGLS